MRMLVLLAAASIIFAATPAAACLEIPTEKGRRQAFKAADDVVRVHALSEAYLQVPRPGSQRVGVATGRVVEVRKGNARVGDILTYRVVDGEDRSGPACPARRFTRPGSEYTLYLKRTPDWGPPIILLPTD